ncbi:MAG: hypothetical protein ACK5OA_06295 [Acidovorax sp.]|jgi:hypothetical protein
MTHTNTPFAHAATRVRLNNRRDPCDVLLVARDGGTRVFKRYNGKAST